MATGVTRGTQTGVWDASCSLREISGAASARARCGRESPPQPASPMAASAAATTPAYLRRRLVRVLLGRELERRLANRLEVTLLDRQRPRDELGDLALRGPLVERAED